MKPVGANGRLKSHAAEENSDTSTTAHEVRSITSVNSPTDICLCQNVFMQTKAYKYAHTLLLIYKVMHMHGFQSKIVPVGRLGRPAQA